MYRRDRIDPQRLFGVERIANLRQWMDLHGTQARRLWAVVDGSFTNGTVIKNLPESTTLVGRIRADAKIHHLPGKQPAKGRRRTVP
jgi:hypothetical protein